MAVVTEQLTTTVTKITEHHDYIYRSKLPDIYIPNHLPLHTYCFEHLPESRDKSCLIDCPTGRVYTYGEVELISRRVAAGLAIHGIRQRDVIMCLLPNSVEFAFIFLGASFRGATTTTANPFYTAGEIAKQIRAAKARMVFTQSVYVDKLREIVEQDPGLKIVCVDAVLGATPKGCLHMSEFIEADESELPEVVISPEDVVALPYSSGTTGMPKGVMLTHKGLVTSVAQQVDGENPNLYFTNEDVLLCVLPLFHIYSLNSVLLCGLRAGSTILIMPKFDIVGLMELVQRYKVTIAPFVPPIVLSIVKCPELESFDLSSIRTVMSGAAPMGKELQDALMARIPNATLGQGYGMTEAGPVLSMCLAFAKEPVPVKSGSCGTVVRNAEMKIVDPETGTSLARNQAGEICIRGAQIMKGYLNDPEATARTIDQDGWLHTGDVGFIDEDEELFIVDRLKELIKYKGFQVAPAELEALLITHPSIADAAVVPMKDEACGEIPVAFVVRSTINGGCATDDHLINISEEDVKKYIAKQVVFYKKLHKVFFLESIPKAPSGKILRKELRARLASTTK